MAKVAKAEQEQRKQSLEVSNKVCDFLNDYREGKHRPGLIQINDYPQLQLYSVAYRSDDKGNELLLIIKATTKEDDERCAILPISRIADLSIEGPLLKIRME